MERMRPRNNNRPLGHMVIGPFFPLIFLLLLMNFDVFFYFFLLSTQEIMATALMVILVLTMHFCNVIFDLTSEVEMSRGMKCGLNLVGVGLALACFIAIFVIVFLKVLRINRVRVASLGFCKKITLLIIAYVTSFVMIKNYIYFCDLNQKEIRPPMAFAILVTLLVIIDVIIDGRHNNHRADVEV